MRLRRPTRRGFIALGAVAAVAVLALSGYAFAAAFTVSKGSTEHAIGNYVAGTNIGTWWTLQKLSTTTIPAGASSPGNASGTPSTLPASGTVSYALNGASGASALLWIFQATTGAPAGQELELQLNYSLSGNNTKFVIYLETPALGLSGLLDVHVYFATSPPALTGGTIQSVTEYTARCTSVGVCP